MFGYVIPCKMELKLKDYERFKAYYCGLCHTIKYYYGNLPRAALNYDMTFLSILLDSLSKEKINVKKLTCVVHPLTKKIIIEKNNALEYASHINIALFYYKLLDDVNDDKSIKAKLGIFLMNKSKSYFSKRFENINELIKDKLKALNLKEAEDNHNSLDEIAHPFSELTGLLIKSYPYQLDGDCEELRENLYWLGYNLGKWIYLIDALDDLKEDMQSNSFNAINISLNKDNLPFNNFYNSIKHRIDFSLLTCSSQCYNAFKQLKLQKNYNIIDNILKLGLVERYEKVLSKYEEETCCTK
ncbi:hypothetical protein CPJCM30710_33550 [Clostridium polyendosporum]|uniref:Uncharacterized protein n=1 Tax=Clostridium polyendosporum TaxID=69208 RepID=A0A919VFU2_9CLOT|nr:DUF5685 family protein [Clostridium polyendosporum]GIM30689.1 hypothetical protein CPJCM30710_33550 [Clostridium polyendosporum]